MEATPAWAATGTVDSNTWEPQTSLATPEHDPCGQAEISFIEYWVTNSTA